MHGQPLDFRLPHDFGEAGAWGGPALPPVPLGPAPSAAVPPPSKKPKAGAARRPSPWALFALRLARDMKTPACLYRCAAAKRLRSERLRTERASSAAAVGKVKRVPMSSACSASAARSGCVGRCAGPSKGGAKGRAALPAHMRAEALGTPEASTPATSAGAPPPAGDTPLPLVKPAISLPCSGPHHLFYHSSITFQCQ